MVILGFGQDQLILDLANLARGPIKDDAKTRARYLTRSGCIVCPSPPLLSGQATVYVVWCGVGWTLCDEARVRSCSRSRMPIRSPPGPAVDYCSFGAEPVVAEFLCFFHCRSFGLGTLAQKTLSLTVGRSARLGIFHAEGSPPRTALCLLVPRTRRSALGLDLEIASAARSSLRLLS